MSNIDDSMAFLCNIIRLHRMRGATWKGPAGEPETAKPFLRDLFSATIGFEVLAGDLLRPSGQFPQSQP